MNNSLTVSAIIIFYNAEKFIEDAVSSVLEQTFADWELLLVDDGSSDGSSEIAKRYAALHPERIRYLAHNGHSNLGASAARNLGVKHSRGRYLAFLDADDVWLPHKLAQQVAVLDAQPDAAMIYGAARYWHGWTGKPEDAARDYVPAIGVSGQSLIAPPTLLTLSLESKAPTACPSDVLIRRETVKAVGGFEEHFGREYQLFEDQAFLAKVYLREPVFVSNEVWILYRQHEDSCVFTTERQRRKYAVGLYYFDWLENYLVTQGIRDEKLWDALARKRWRYRHPHLAALPGRLRARAAWVMNSSKRLTRRTLPASAYEWLRHRAPGRGNKETQSEVGAD